MKVAILGSRGFVGSRIANEATRRGWLVNHIGSQTRNVKELISDSDAVIHSVGSFMPDRRYKKLVSEPISVKNIVQLAMLRLKLSPSNPLTRTDFVGINFATVKSAADNVVSTHLSSGEDKTPFPFVFLSAATWELVEPEYIRSKRMAEAYLDQIKGLRPVFLRPGFIDTAGPASCRETSPRHLLGQMLRLSNSPYWVTVQAVAEAACDAVEDASIRGTVEAEVLRKYLQDP